MQIRPGNKLRKATQKHVYITLVKMRQTTNKEKTNNQKQNRYYIPVCRTQNKQNR